jgi:hypothetical protein
MNERVKELAEQSGLVLDGEHWFSAIQQADVRNVDLERFAELIRLDEREAISNEYFMSLDSDLENGVKWLNDKAHEDFKTNYPELSKFGNWLSARSSHE